MPDMEFNQIAQQMVEATSSLVSGRTVNIMDTDGVIIASTEKERIGTLHSGAAIAMQTGRPVAIEKEQVALYPGAKEGCNMPMFSGGKALGVVGIYGDPQEVYDTARLLSAYTVQYFEHNANLQQQMVENELRNKLLGLLLHLGGHEDGNIAALMKALHIRLVFPVRVLAIGLQNEMDSVGSLHIFNTILSRMRATGYLDPKLDIWGVHDNRITVIKSDMDGQDAELIQHIQLLLSESPEAAFRISAGYMCNGVEDIRQSALEAAALFETGDGDVLDITDMSCFVRYVLYQAEQRHGAYMETLYARLLRSFGEKEISVALETAACYYETGGSVNRSANMLHIHKNTLQYRIRRVWDALGVTEMHPFMRECIVRLCIGYHHRNKSQRDL